MIQSSIIHHQTSIIKSESKRLGFLSCGISKAGFLEEEAPRLENWLNNRMNGQMSYMENHFDKRLNPTLLVDNAKSVISLLLNYYPSELQNQDSYKISKYAYGQDYHHVIKEKLKEFTMVIRKSITYIVVLSSSILMVQRSITRHLSRNLK